MTGQRETLLLFLYSLLVGLWLGSVYDIFRVMRIALYGRKKAEKERLIPLGKDAKSVGASLKGVIHQGFPSPSFFFTFVCDVLFCIFSALTVTVMIFQFGDGRVRAFSMIGAAFGFVLYYFTIGRAVMFFSDTIISAIKTVIGVFLKITFYPICRILARVAQKIKHTLDDKKRERNTKKYMRHMLDKTPNLNFKEKSREVK